MKILNVIAEIIRVIIILISLGLVVGGGWCGVYSLIESVRHPASSGYGYIFAVISACTVITGLVMLFALIKKPSKKATAEDSADVKHDTNINDH